ncbi:hypothetical protein JS278_02827 [Acidipropionibacterium virtanenii]|uniref:YfhO family protein n=2 Tax=Acidipropionibacterium virtanenii TaxID=2057246 RepID=A0A344UXG4_9ACTN|nr:hypothetical protein JS278_02827 [Acidipropionibacterium virtanenii]
MTVLLIMRGSGIRPFGVRSNIIGDDGAQYLEFYAVFRDILTGSHLSSPQFSWALGAGVPFLPTYATYLGGPFTFLVALFPANRVSTAITVIVVAKLVVASAVMYALLRTLGPRRHPLLAGLLGISYATCTWVFDIGWFNQQWLDGLIAFPALALVALRCRGPKHHLWPGVLVVALFWWSNFYSAYMASVGAVIVLVAVEAASSTGLRRSAARIGRFALTGVLGVALTAPTLIPTLTGLRNGSPTPGTDLAAVRWSGILVRLLPMTEGVVLAPALFCSSAALLLVLGIPAALHLSVRTRAVLVVVAVAVLASLKAPTLLLAWNAFQVPHGMPFRCGFVISGLIIVAAHTAWPPRRTHPRAVRGATGLRRALTASRDWPGPLAWGCAAVLFALLSRIVEGPGEEFLFVDPRAAQPGWAALGIGLVASLVVTAATARGGRSWRRVMSVVLVLATLGGTGLTLRENLANSLFVNVKLRIWASELFPRASQDAARLRAAEAATRKAGWPLHRVNVDLVSEDPIWSRYNSSGRYSFPGINYYSTTIEASTARPLVNLGYSDRNGGRTLYRPHDEVLSSLLAAYDPHSRFDPLPMVRTVPTIKPQAGLSTDMATRETLLGAHLYSSPRLYRVTGRRERPIASPLVVPAGTNQDVRISCPAGQYVVSHQYFNGMMMLRNRDGGSVQVAESHEIPKKRVVGPHFLIKYSDGTPTTVEFKANGAVPPQLRTIEPDGLACLDLRPLERQIAVSEAPSSLRITPSRIEARFSQPRSGRLVVATPAADGWRCRVDGRSAPIEPLAGMLAVKTSGAREFSCGYKPPGLSLGISVAALAGLVIVIMATTPWRRGFGQGERS